MGIAPSRNQSRPADFPQPSRSKPWTAAAIACAALVVFAFSLSAKSFEDEFAYISQSYYADLFFSGRFNDRAWLEFPAYDLQPLPKYLIGFSLRLANLPLPSARDAGDWYLNYKPFGVPITLLVARLPFVGLGALGCVAIFACGAIVKDARAGVIAAILLMADPLYRLHSHRAMSDVPCEAFMLVALGLYLWVWRRIWCGQFGLAPLLAAGLAGGSAGLSLLCKFNGFLALMVVTGWSCLALIAPGLRIGRRLLIACTAIAVITTALGVSVGLNPYLTAQPLGPMPKDTRERASQGLWQRFDSQVKHRVKLSKQQQVNMPHNALHTLAERAKVFAVQGWGRFGPFGPSDSDSTVRYGLRQDWGAIVWGPLVLVGFAAAVRLGWNQIRAGDPPVAFAMVTWALTAWIVVAVYLPMAWNRYLLPIQSANALLGAVALAPVWDPLVERARAWLARPAAWVFLILLGSYSFFWHTRDWNTASRLMLTYALVDRGTVTITGLDQQTNDKARFQGQYYSDKLPGFPLLATLPYASARLFLRLPSHPLDREAFKYWPADYWTTLGTSGLLTAATGWLLVTWSRELGCQPLRSALVGLAYGLATPAYVYATLAYGHQAAAFALLASFFLLWKPKRPHNSVCVFIAGLLAAYAAVIELHVGPVSAILGIYLLAQCLRGDRRLDALALFAVGALVPTLILLMYNLLAFGSPWELGYFHHAVKQFADVHNPDNPLGLTLPKSMGTTLTALLWGRYRGLTFYAPILLLSGPGWVVLLARRCWDLASVTLLVVLAVLLVNLFYPEWTGGWSTGPRLLVPALPFAMLPVAALIAGDSRLAGIATLATLALALAGAILMLLFQGVGGRIPQYLADPMLQIVWPLWSGRSPIPDWWLGERFCCNLTSLIASGWLARQLPSRQFVQFLPLVLAQSLAIVGLCIHHRRPAGERPPAVLEY
jgi:hypothetical protein